jgi:ADP-ribose pyrophosphatase
VDLDRSKEDLNAVYRFRVLVKGLVTNRGDVLLLRKDEDNMDEGTWQIPGGHLEHGEALKQGIMREIEEQTGLSIEIHQIVDALSFSEEEDSVQIVYHCEADTRNQELKNNLGEVEWIPPEKVAEKLNQQESDMFNDREKLENFLQKLEELPSY